MSRISIISVNYNQPVATMEFLRSVSACYSQGDIEVIVVDNGSLEDNENEFSACFKDIIYIRSLKNLGFAGGNNLGIKSATGDLLFFVNNDTVFTPGLIEHLRDTMQANSMIGAISPKIIYFDEPSVIQYAGFTPMNYYTCSNRCVGQFETDLQQYDHLVGPTGFAHGAAMMVSRAALDAAGPMPENFFLYYEEMDWCEMIRRKGFEIWVNTNATIYHKESLAVGKDSPLKEYFMNRNRILFIRRNANAFQRLIFYIYFALLVVPRNCIRYLLKGQRSYLKTLFNAIKWHFVNSKNSLVLGYKLK